MLKEANVKLEKQASEFERERLQKQQEVVTLRAELEKKEMEISRLQGERTSVAEQIEAILNELDNIEI